MILKINPKTSGVRKMVKHTLKIFQQTLQEFWRVFDHFVDTRCFRVEV